MGWHIAYETQPLRRHCSNNLVLSNICLVKLILLFTSLSTHSTLLELLSFSSSFYASPHFSLAEGWPHSSHAYFQLLSNQKEMLFWGDTLWWNRRRGEVCIVQELMAHECSSTEERQCGALFKVKHSLKDVIVPLVNAWQVFKLPLVGWARPPPNKSTKWKKKEKALENNSYMFL